METESVTNAVEQKELIMKVVEVIALIVSVGAMALAIITEKKVKDIYSSARKITDSISTKYVGKFPENMEEVIKLISSTKRKLIITSDVPSYGHFSNPRGFAQYKNAILNLLTNEPRPHIVLITYDHEKRLANSRNQFNKTYEEVVNGAAYKNYFEYHRNNKSIKPPEQPDKDGFCKWLEGNHIEFIKNMVAAGVQVFESSRDIRSFSWIGDDSAILSFHNYGNELREVSFKTSDQSLVDILKVFADATIENSKEYEC